MSPLHPLLKVHNAMHSTCMCIYAYFIYILCRLMKSLHKYTKMRKMFTPTSVLLDQIFTKIDVGGSRIQVQRLEIAVRANVQII